MPHLDTMPSPTHHFIEASASQSRADLANALVLWEKKVLESPPAIHSNEKITTFPWKSHSNTGCWWMFHCYITLLQLVWYQQGAKIKVFSNSIQFDPIHLMAVNCILYMLHSLILCKGMLAIDPWEPDLSEGPALAKMSHENDLWGCLSLENTSWTWAWHLKRIGFLQIDVVCMLVAWNVQWKNRQFHIESLLLNSSPQIFFRILPENYQRPWSQKWIDMVHKKLLYWPVWWKLATNKPNRANQTGQPTN